MAAEAMLDPAENPEDEVGGGEIDDAMVRKNS